MLLQRLIGNIYSILIEIILWLVLIASTISGGIIFPLNGLSIGLGIILGLILGILINLILLSPLVILLDIRNSLKIIEKK